MISRRYFLKSSGVAFAGLSFAPLFLRTAAAAAPYKGKVLVVLFQRGAADGLSMVPPTADPRYFEHRPNLAVAKDKALALDDTFGLHPALAPLKALYDAKTLSVVHAVGSTQPTRSHFDAQDFMEAGTPGTRGGNDGWMNRVVGAQPIEGSTAFRAVALQANLPRALWGPAPAVAFGALADFRIRGGGVPKAANGFEAMYASAVDEALRVSATEAFDAMQSVTTQKLMELKPQNGAEYPSSPLGRRLQDIARLVRGDVGLQLAATDCGGWDTHVAQGAAEGQLANRLKDFGAAIGAFNKDLGEKMRDVVFVTMTEFGRTVKENGNRGTDHGTASVMFVMGGNVKGGRVLCGPDGWSGLAVDKLHEERDLAVRYDYRSVISEVLTSRLAVPKLAAVFPGLGAQKGIGIFG
jgi:uncharacterized protein (DUF1501 family)